MKAVTRFILLILCIFATVAHGRDQTATGFFYPTGTASFDQKCGTWLGRDTKYGGCYFSGFYHTGVDMMREKDKDVYAVADGKVVGISYDDGSGDIWGIGNCALVIEHETYDGSIFSAVYGHLQCGTIPARKSDIYGGKSIGKIGYWKNGDHLHFSIHPGPYGTIARAGWGKMPNSSWTSPCTGSCLNTFTDPIAFIQTNYAYNPSTELRSTCQGDICWEPVTASCETAMSWYRLVNPPYAQPEGSGVCTELRSNLTYITSASNPQERIPEHHGWRKWWRAAFDFFGKVANAAEIRSFETFNIINVYTGTVVAGNAKLAVYGAGAGYATQVADLPIPSLPDFITSKVALSTPLGVETYRFGYMEKVDIDAYVKNVGDADWAGDRDDMYVTAYLSHGYKVDSHSEWVRVGQEQIKRGNIDVGKTKHERFTVDLPDFSLGPGMYNFVVCADRKYDQDNGDGEVPEKHKSNNCSTEAVFEVAEEGQAADTPITPEPRPAPQLVITKFQDESGCCTTNTGSRIKPNIWVRNDGPASPGANVTIIYHISSPVATGGAYIHIGYGSIEPRELPSGGTDEDYMDGSWSIPKSGAWKNQWHTIRGCLKADGSTPVGDPNTEVCAYYTRYSKK